MSDESAIAQEIPAEDDELRVDLASIDRDGGARVVPPVGSALSTLWWVEDESTATR